MPATTTRNDLESIKEAARKLTAESRHAQGLTEHVEDGAVLRHIAELVLLQEDRHHGFRLEP